MYSSRKYPRWATGPPKHVNPSRVATPNTSNAEPCLSLRFASEAGPAWTVVTAAVSTSSWLEQLDRVARRVLEQDLFATWSSDDVIAEGHAGGAQSGDLGADVFDEQVNAIPPTGARLPAIRHGSPSRA